MKQFVFAVVVCLIALPAFSAKKNENAKEMSLAGTIIKKEQKANTEGKKARTRNPYSLKLENGTVLYIPKYAVSKKVDFEPFVDKNVVLKAQVVESDKKGKTKQRIVKVITVEIASSEGKPATVK